MKFNLFLFSGLMVSTGLLMGCEKGTTSYHPVVSLRVVNALMGGGNMKINTNERDSVLMHNAKAFDLAIVDNQVAVKVWPSAESAKPYYNNQFEAQGADIYTLYLFGMVGSTESLLVKEQMPAWYSDSVIGVRVAHCAPGSGAVNITLKSDPTSPVIRQINYKTISDIVKIRLPGVIPAGTASFEVRDAADDKLLATYILPANANSLYPGISIALQRFKNITLVIKGSRDSLSGPNAFGVFPASMSY